MFYVCQIPREDCDLLVIWDRKRGLERLLFELVWDTKGEDQGIVIEYSLNLRFRIYMIGSQGKVFGLGIFGKNLACDMFYVCQIPREDCDLLVIWDCKRGLEKLLFELVWDTKGGSRDCCWVQFKS